MSLVLQWLSERSGVTDARSAPEPEDPRPAVERLVEDIHEDARRREADAVDRLRQRLFDLD